MTTRPFAIAAAAALLAASGYGLFLLGERHATAMPAAAAAKPAASAPAAVPQTLAEGQAATQRHLAAGLKAGDIDPANGRRILYYHDPMVPGNRFDAPGKSPFMDMVMTPVYADGGADAGTVAVSPRIQQNLGVRTAVVTEGSLSSELSAVGSIAFNERDQDVVQARATGFVERLHVRATLDPIAKGQALADLYVPDWIAAQEEFLSLQRMPSPDLAALRDGARQRMRQVGMSDEQIRLVESTGKTQPRMTLRAPIGGVLVELNAREGMTVMPGATLFRINGLGSVWAVADVPETQAAGLRPGAKVRARSGAFAGTDFDGKVQAILPQVDPATRTLKARVELANPGGRLVPGMFVTMLFTQPSSDKAVLIPSEALIQTGKRSVVLLAEDGGHFRPVDVQAGAEVGGQTQVLRGLRPGQRVVVSSQFLVDSEATLKGVETRLAAPATNDTAAGPPPPPSASAVRPQAPAASVLAARYEATAKVEAIGPGALTLSHTAIPALGWDPMTMDFKRPPGALPAGLAVGDRVSFEFTLAADHSAQLTRVTRLGAAPGSKQ
jgi:Cu(I)/Ag(I) efflux system membrane fusion protein